MNCREFRKYVGAFADGELDTQTSASVLEHLNMCPHCAQQVDEVQRMKDAVGRVLGVEDASPELAQRIRAAIQSPEAALQPPSRKLVYRLITVAGMAAAVALAVLVWPSQGPQPVEPAVQATFVVRRCEGPAQALLRSP